MSYETQSDEQQGQDVAGDLNAALADAETKFVTEEKKQISAGTIVVGGLLVACTAATWFMYVRNSPTAAAANPATAAADATITQFLTDDTQNVARMKQLLEDTDKAVQQFQNDQTKAQIPIDQLQTNPFRADSADMTVAAEKVLEQKKKDQLLKEANGLKVQSIIHGKRRAAMINNTLYTEGQQVNGFLIEKIQPGEVVVRADKYRFKLLIQK